VPANLKGTFKAVLEYDTAPLEIVVKEAEFSLG